ncbi:hypothetical protein GCM10027578_20400 [Spirosoma luteolum]
MLLTICSISQLPQALALAASYITHQPTRATDHPDVVIGLVDELAQLPADVAIPYPIIALGELYPADRLARLSAQYSPVELAGACKPRFIREVFRRYPTVSQLLYADPNVLFLHSVTALFTALAGQTLLLTPHLLQAPGDTGPRSDQWPDEKALQNVGLYSADFLALGRSTETDRLLDWWIDRVEERAYIDYCEGLCTDQIWLMHTPVFFSGVQIIHDPAWHVALWNLPQRRLRASGTGWQLTDTQQPVLFANLKGLYQPNEGFFPYQTRFRLATRPDAQALLTAYRQQVAATGLARLASIRPAYGARPVVPIVRGWRRSAAQALRSVNGWITAVDLPRLPGFR